MDYNPTKPICKSNLKTNDKTRLDWVDISKGIVICLMVLGHSGIPEWLSRWIWSFHMPFFFIISAMFTSWNRVGFKRFAVTRAKLLLLPFVVYSLINLILLSLSSDINLTDYIIAVLQKGWGGIALWFVPVFYLSLIICKICDTKYLLYLAIALFTGAIILAVYKIELPWAISSVPYAAALMLIVRKFQKNIRNVFAALSVEQKSISAIAGLSISYLISIYWHLDLATNTILPFIQILIGVGGGCIFVMMISMLMSKFTHQISMIFRNIGRNTYEIMAMSQVIIISINHFYPVNAIVKYALLIIVLIMIVYLRKLVEGRFSKQEAI